MRYLAFTFALLLLIGVGCAEDFDQVTKDAVNSFEESQDQQFDQLTVDLQKQDEVWVHSEQVLTSDVMKVYLLEATEVLMGVVDDPNVVRLQNYPQGSDVMGEGEYYMWIDLGSEMTLEQFEQDFSNPERTLLSGRRLWLGLPMSSEITNPIHWKYFEEFDGYTIEISLYAADEEGWNQAIQQLEQIEWSM